MPRYSIVSVHYRDSYQFLADLPIGTPIKLIREPTNKFDPNAIMVWVDGVHVGYIPRRENLILAERIDCSGIPVERDIDKGNYPETFPFGQKAIDGTFIRSPNSKFPMVKVPMVEVETPIIQSES
jgi:hypothetical protein